MDTIFGCFERQVAAHPDALAIEDNGRRVTYRELDTMVRRLAVSFPKAAYVGVVADHSAEMIATLLAVVACGAAYVPVEPSFPRERIRFILRECHVDFVVTNEKYRQLLDGFPLRFIGPDIKPAPEVGKPARFVVRPEDAAYVLYTSGSTGRPKGVIVENRNVCHYVRAFQNEFHPAPGDVMLQYSVCTFDIFVEEVFTTLLSGAALAIPPAAARASLPALMRFVAENGVTIISGFPYLLAGMNRLPAIPSSLRLLISGGDVLRGCYVEHLLPQVAVYNTYGPSETTVCASYYRCNGQASLPDGTYPIGKAVLGTDIEVRDEELRPVPCGQVGEICIFGGGVSRGYIGGRQEENKAFVVFPDGRRMYRSGDLGVMQDDGTLLFLHRKDDQVMIRGRRVEVGEVQSVLCQCPEVEVGAVRSVEDEQGLAYLTAYFVPRSGARFSLSRLRGTMGKFLPDYMLPEFFVRMKTMPLTPNGKIDVRALPEVLKTGNV